MYYGNPIAKTFINYFLVISELKDLVGSIASMMLEDENKFKDLTLDLNGSLVTDKSIELLMILKKKIKKLDFRNGDFMSLAGLERIKTDN